MYFVCSAFFNMGKKRCDIVSFLYKVFPLYFSAGESVLAKKMPGLEKVYLSECLLTTSLNGVISSWHILLVINGLYQSKLYLIAK